jgi:hypothetical protein
VGGLKQALQDGTVDGNEYNGDCACLCGTIADLRGCHYTELAHIDPEPRRPAEQWFIGIAYADRPDNNAFAGIALAWLEEFESAFAST